ncbi:hypothetical protein HOY80DRAFT_8598 [Tuber brumale]|nr:hypothetical protein HOY80DRAFT_8598 [Tuber brumale]
MLALLLYHPRATHSSRNICIQEASTLMMAPTTIREPSHDSPALVSPHICVGLSFYRFLLFLSSLLPYLLRIDEQYKGEGWNWNCGNGGILSPSALCSERNIGKKDLGTLWKEGQGLRRRAFLLSSLAITLASLFVNLFGRALLPNSFLRVFF